MKLVNSDKELMDYIVSEGYMKNDTITVVRKEDDEENYFDFEDIDISYPCICKLILSLEGCRNDDYDLYIVYEKDFKE